MRSKSKSFVKFSVVFFVVGFVFFANTNFVEAATIDVSPNGTIGSSVPDSWGDIISDANTCNPDTLSGAVIDDGCYTVDKGDVLLFSSFDTSGIPAGSVITGAVLHFQYGAENGYNGTNPVNYNNGTLTTTGIAPTDITGWSADQTFDLYAAGVDTLAEITAVDIEFTNNDGGAADAIHFDYIWITVTYSASTVLGTGTDTTSTPTIGPGGAATEIDRFSLATSTGIDTVTGMTVTLAPANAYTNIATVGVYTTGDVLKCSATPSSNSVALTSCAISVTTTPTDYVVKITPKTHANMPAVPGASYATTATVTSITATNATSGSDTNTVTTVTVDNTSPGAAIYTTVSTTTAGAVDIYWTNPSDSDFTTNGTVVVLRRASNAITQVPEEGRIGGTAYNVNDLIGGTDYVACVVTGSPPATSCQDTGLTAGTPYHYKIFTEDSRGNYNAGTVPTGSPATPISAKHVTGTSNSTGTVKVAINGTLNGASTTISGGNFDITLTGVQPVADDVITVFIQSASQTDESTAVAKYDGSGDITGIILNQNVLSIGSANDQIISVSDLGLYDCDQSEDIMHSSNSGTLLLDGCSNGYTNPTMQVESGDTFESSGVEVITAKNITNNGTISENSWRYSRAITIDYTKVSSSAQTNFPVLVKGTYSYLATTGNGGKVNHASGYDIAFFSDASLSHPLKFEREKWVATTGEIVAWVKIPSLSNTVNTVIYMAYGNTSISSDQADPNNVWDSDYLSVYHLGDGSSISLTDSTSNGNTLVNGNSTPATAGPINGGANFVRANSNYMYGGTTIHNGLQTTRSAWVNPSSIPTAGFFRNILGNSNGIDAGFLDQTLEYNSDQKAYFYAYCGSSRFTSAGSNTIPTGTWVYLTATHDYEGSSMKLYLNGQLEGSIAIPGCINNYSSPNLYISGRGTATGASNYGDFFDGKIAEPRFSKTVRSAGWVATEYNNQNSPSTFYSVGNEVALAPILNITKDLTVSAGTVSGAYSTVTVNGDIKCGATCGTMSYTGGLVEQKVAANQNFGTSVSADSTAWTFANLKFSNSTGTSKTITVPTAATGAISVTGTLSIGTSGDTGATVLDAGNRTWNLSSNGTPLSILSSPQGVLTPSTSTFNFNPASSSTVTVAAATYNNVIFNSASTAFNLGGTAVVNSTLTLTTGTFNASNYNITMANFSSSNSNTRTITMGSGTWSLTGTGTVWDTATTTGLTVTPNTSTIKLVQGTGSATGKTFAGGGKTYNSIWLAPASSGTSTGSITFTGSNTFNDFKDDNNGAGAAHSILFTNGTTTTVTTWNVSGTAGNLITINSDNTSTHTLTKAGGSTISSDYLNIQHSVATPADTWYAGDNSTDNQSVTVAGSGWIFTAPPVIPCTSQLTTANWNSTATWACNRVPTTADDITITSGHTITMDIDSAVLGAITINGTLNTSDGTSRSLSGTNIAIGSSGTLTANGSNITLSGTSGTLFTMASGGVFTPGSSTLILSGNGDAIINSPSIVALNGLTISGTGTKKAGSPLSMSSLNVSNASGTFHTNSFGVTITGDVTNSGTFTIDTGVGTDVDALAFINAAGITDQTQETAIDNLVYAAKAHGWWSKMKAIYPFVGGTATTHKWNLKDPRDLDAAYRLTFTGGWTHTSTGADPDGSTGYADTKFVPSGNLSLNSSHLSYYSRENTAYGLSYDIGVLDVNSNKEFSLMLRRSNDSSYSIIHGEGASEFVTTSVTDSRGYFIGSRTSSTSHTYYQNGASIGTATATNTSSLGTRPIYIGAFNNNGTAGNFGNKEVAFATIGDGIDSTMAADMYNDIQAFQTALGRQIGTAHDSKTISVGGTSWTNTGNINAGTSTIKLTDTSASAKTFAGGGATYNNLWLAGGSGGGSYTISGNNTFNILQDDSTDADAAHSIQFTAGSTQTISDFDVAGTSGNLITLTSTTTSPFNLIKTSLTDVLSDYLSIQYSSVSPYGEWLAGTNSTNLGSNTGWIFNTKGGSRGGGGGNAGGESSGGGTPVTGGTGTGGGGGNAGGESSGGGTPSTGGTGTGGGGGDVGYIYKQSLLAYAQGSMNLLAMLFDLFK